jgi:hypothetical protein
MTLANRRRHLRQGESWTYCGRRWAHGIHTTDDTEWPVCAVCERAFKLQPEEPRDA